jgi:anti-sigma factor (TIGR02949 family)
MTHLKFLEPGCRKVLASLDSYIDNELRTETNLDLTEHLRRCAHCTQEADERQKMRSRLRTAVREVHVPSSLENRVRDRIRQSRQPQSKKIYLMAIAAAVVVCFGSWITFRSTTDGPAELVAHVGDVMRVGLKQHIHCAVIRQRNTRPAEGVDKLTSQFKELAPIVQQHIPANLSLNVAHECSFEGRKFVHLTFRDGRNLLSLVIARKGGGESFQSARLLPALTHSGIPMYTSGAGRYQIAAFETDGFLVYAVSELPRAKNLDVLTALAPALHRFLARIPS